MERVRIAMLTTFYPPYSFGGDAIGVERLASAVARRGHHVSVVHDVDAYMTLAGQEPVARAADDNVEVIGLRSRIGLVSNLLTHQTGQPVVHRARLRDILKPGAFDIIWFHNLSLIGGPGLLSFGDGLKIYEAHEHGLVCPTHVLWRYNRELCDSRQCVRCSISYRRPPQLWRHFGFWHRQLAHVDAFIAKSEFSRKKHRDFGFARTMEVVPYFLPDTPHPVLERAASPHSRPYFLFVGRLEKLGSIRVSQRYFQAFWGFSWVISWERPCGSSWKTRSVFQGAVGAFCASTAPSASTGPVRGRQDGSQGGEPGVMSNWTAASSDCGRDDVHIRTADLYRPNARFTPERQRYQVLTPFGKLGYSPESHCQNRQEPGVGISPPGPLRRHDLLDRR